MTRTVRTRCAALILAALATFTAGCGASEPTPAANAAPTSSAPAPLPTQDWNKLACHTLPTDWLETLENLADTRKAAEYAMKSSDRIMSQHGRDLRDAVNARETADLNGERNPAVDANLDISKSALKVAEACATLYGDGPW
ncbi:hypothetical protein ONO86_05659 [Micromonospora noduli]|uniref:hypothetical protein n=2 Tax=Micromonospora noduli TaxID=709876 RepID=UPI000DC3DC79|nr:hypothetical protein [Micromonospora noduli]RAO30106.1 hypothetical protein ONO86_05659 [Micromonospora noduli]